MSLKWPWFERSFTFDFPTSKFPDILERLRGTPARVEELIARVPPAVLTRPNGKTWSIQENVGHLTDVEPLWDRRIDDILGGAPTMREADLTNAKTFNAGHNDRDIGKVAAEFRDVRSRFVQRLESLTAADTARTANHPRLDQPMRLVDLCHFVAEHDDYHLARITVLKKMFL